MQKKRKDRRQRTFGVKKLCTSARVMDHVKENERIIEWIIMVTDNMVDL